ncbi:MAG: cytochrome CBB3 [Porticoccaceae bacterium]|nr:MAG: cytochrome CBB3 [Porticoccaceae bacterium]
MKAFPTILSLGFIFASWAALGAVPPGERIYRQHCAVCHEGGVAKAPERTMLEMLAPEAILRALEEGVMRVQGSALTPEERRLLAEHLAGASLGGTELAERLPRCPERPFDYNAPPEMVGWGVDLGNRRHFDRRFTRIDGGNIHRLQLAWVFPFPGAVRVRSQPAVAGGSLFVGSQDGTVYALDQNSGCIRWTFRASAEVRTGIVVEPWRAGEQADPLLFFGDLIGNVYALGAVSGDLRWRDRPDGHPSLTITAAPALYGGRLYVPLSSLEVTAAGDPHYPCCTFRGGVAVYDAHSGQRLAVLRTIEEEPKQVGRNPLGTPIYAPSGAPVWNTPAIDPKLRRFYFGTGENYSSPSTDTSDAILAYGVDDYRRLWVMQATRGDAWNISCETPERTNCPVEDGPDYDFGAAVIRTSLPDGREVLLAGQKSGEVFALDPRDGGVLWRRKLGRGGIQGGVHFGMAADGQVLYVPMSDFYGGPRWPGEGRPGMYAVDIASGEVLWFRRAEDRCAGREHCQPGFSAAVSAIDGAVVAGGMDGRLVAFARADGAVLWEFDALRTFPALGGFQARGGSFGGAAGPVFAGDMMYVPSGYGIYSHMPGNALLAFRLAGEGEEKEGGETSTTR